MKTRQAFRIHYYSGKKPTTQFYTGKIRYFIEFRNQLERFAKANDFKASQEDIDCVCAENVITKAKLYHFSKN